MGGEGGGMTEGALKEVKKVVCERRGGGRETRV